MADTMRASLDRRIRVLVVRRRLEESAATLVERARGGKRPRSHRVVEARLLLLSAGAQADEHHSVHGLARRAAYVYAATSTALHSRRAFGDVPEHLVREWEQTVADVEATLAKRI